jgi:hypothetical protein
MSDFVFLLNGRPFNDYGYPLLFIETCSDTWHQRDRFRMLLQAGLLVRAMNSFKDDSKQPFKSFVVMAVYIIRGSIAERYLVYQTAKGSVVRIAMRIFAVHYLQFAGRTCPGPIRPQRSPGRIQVLFRTS